MYAHFTSKIYAACKQDDYNTKSTSLKFPHCMRSKRLYIWQFFSGIYGESKEITHTIYTRNNMGQKCEGNCGLWVLNEILKETYPESLKKIVGAVWELPAK